MARAGAYIMGGPGGPWPPQIVSPEFCWAQNPEKMIKKNEKMKKKIKKKYIL